MGPSIAASWVGKDLYCTEINYKLDVVFMRMDPVENNAIGDAALRSSFKTRVATAGLGAG